MWVRRTAIRPVPAWAKVPLHALDAVREHLADDEEEARDQLDDGFERFESEQPVLAAFVGETLGKQLDETALALGYFLTLAVWMAFEQAYGDALGPVDEAGLVATQELFELDEELRKNDPTEALDTDDVIGMEQPHLVEFAVEHVDATLEAHSDDVDVDDVNTVYRIVLVEILALSYAVRRPEGHPKAREELLA